MKNKYYCAGCLGLAVGAVMGILFMCLYVVIPLEPPDHLLIGLFCLGLLLVIVNFIDTGRPSRNGWVHLFSNVLLIIGFFLVVMSVFQATSDVGFGLTGIIVSFLWLDTRIQLSRWIHLRTCKKCAKTCKSY